MLTATDGMCYPGSTDSIFIVKALESDSHSFYDTDHVLQRAAKADWSHCKKPRFLSDEADQKMVLATLKNHYRTLKELFRYYSAVGDGNPFCIQYNSFLTMVKHFGMNPSHLGCDVIFKGEFDPDAQVLKLLFASLLMLTPFHTRMQF